MNSGTSVIFGSANSASIGPMISRATVREAPGVETDRDADEAADEHPGRDGAQRGQRLAQQRAVREPDHGLREDRRGPAPEQLLQHPVGRELPAQASASDDRRLSQREPSSRAGSD